MAVGAFAKLGGTTIEITEEKHEKLLRDSQNLKVLSSFIRQDNVFKSDIEKLLDAMENKAPVTEEITEEITEEANNE